MTNSKIMRIVGPETSIMNNNMKANTIIKMLATITIAEVIILKEIDNIDTMTSSK